MFKFGIPFVLGSITFLTPKFVCKYEDKCCEDKLKTYINPRLISSSKSTKEVDEVKEEKDKKTKLRALIEKDIIDRINDKNL